MQARVRPSPLLTDRTPVSRLMRAAHEAEHGEEVSERGGDEYCVQARLRLSPLLLDRTPVSRLMRAAQEVEHGEEVSERGRDEYPGSLSYTYIYIYIMYVCVLWV